MGKMGGGDGDRGFGSVKSTVLMGGQVDWWSVGDQVWNSRQRVRLEIKIWEHLTFGSDCRVP